MSLLWGLFLLKTEYASEVNNDFQLKIENDKKSIRHINQYLSWIRKDGLVYDQRPMNILVAMLNWNRLVRSIVQ